MALVPDTDITTHDAGEGMSEPVANEAYFRLSMLCGGGIEVLDRDLTAPPGGESEGEIWIPLATASGAWAGEEDNLAIYFNAGWIFITPVGGWQCYIKDEKIWYGYSSEESAWHPMQRTYSTTEYWTGEYYSGDKLYAKTVDVGALPNATSSTDAHSISNLGTVVRVIAAADNATNQIPIPNSGSARDVEIYIDDTNINLVTTDDLSGYDGIVTLEFTKTA